jgi:hypothetical protein
MNNKTVGAGNQNIESFYKEFGIKQYNSFSGGFRYLEKPSQTFIQ